MRDSPFNLLNHVIRVVKHDEGINARSCTYTRVCWLMFLAFPLDFQKDLYIRAAIAPYGRLLDWYHDENKSRILAQALILSPDRMLRSLAVSRGTLIGGMGRSWSVPVYILNGHFPDAFPADEVLFHLMESHIQNIPLLCLEPTHKTPIGKLNSKVQQTIWVSLEEILTLMLLFSTRTTSLVSNMLMLAMESRKVIWVIMMLWKCNQVMWHRMMQWM